MRRLNWRHTGRFCCAAFSMDFAAGMFTVALPYLAMGMGAGSLDLGVLGALRGTAYAVCCTAFAFLSDRHSRRRLIATGSVAIVIVLTVTAASARLWHLFVTSILLSLALAFFWPPLYSWLGDSHRREELAPAIGAVNLSWSGGMMAGGLVAGWLYDAVSSLTFLFAGIPALAALAVVGFASREHAGPVVNVRGEEAAEPGRPGAVGTTTLSARPGAVGTTTLSARPGAKRALAAAYLGNVSICGLVGVMCSVFPKLGSEIGVTSSIFGGLVFGLGLARSLVFALGFWAGDRLRRLRYSGLGQILAAGMVATVSAASSHWWLALVFVCLGLAFGATFYRGLYLSLEAPGRRGLKSGLHEAALLSGILLGSVGGGVLAHAWGPRAPYVPLAAAAVLLVIAQAALTASARCAADAGRASEPALGLRRPK